MGDRCENWIFLLEKYLLSCTKLLTDDETTKLDGVISDPAFKALKSLTRDRLLVLIFVYNLSILENPSILDTILNEAIGKFRFIFFYDVFQVYSKHSFLDGKFRLLDIFSRYSTLDENLSDIDSIEQYLRILVTNLEILFCQIDHHLYNIEIIVGKIDLHAHYWIARSVLSVSDKILTKLLNEKIYRLNDIKGSTIVDSITRIHSKLGLLNSNFQHQWFGGIRTGGNGDDDNFERLKILVSIKLSVMSGADYKFTYNGDEKSIIDLFSDQDDQLCEILLCNIMVNGQKKSSLNDHLLLINLLRTLNFSNDVFVEWIVSPETLFLPYFTRYLKLFRNNIEEFKLVSSEYPYDEIVYDVAESKTEENDSEVLLIDAYEYVGDILVKERVRIEPLRRQETDTSILKTRKIELDIHKKIFDVLPNLNAKLKKFNDKKCIPFNINYLLKLLSECENLLDVK